MGLADRLGVICGMEVEARYARCLTSDVACAAGQRRLAQHAATQMLDEGVTALLSFGVAGALAPHLKPGDVVIGTKVLTYDAVWTADSALTARLRAALPQAYDGMIWSEGDIVPTAALKADLFERSACLAADQESAGMAQAAAPMAAPFAVLRVIVDTAQHSLPPAALLPFGENGRPRCLDILGSLIQHPGQIHSLLKIASSMGKATHKMRSISCIINRI